MVPMGLFITLEGIEGSGKSTQIGHLARHLRERGRQVVVTREPGGCTIADRIRAILLHPEHTALVPKAELLLYAAARAQHVAEVVQPALQRGETVLCDRFTMATLAYQGFGRGLSRQLIDELNQLACAGTRPDATIVLDLPVEIGLTRARARNLGSALDDEGRFEAESLAFHQRIRDGYLQLAREDERALVVSAEGSEEEIRQRLRVTVDALLAGGGR